MKSITPKNAKYLSEQGTEFALLDVREAGQFGEGHAFFAANVPYSRLELEIGSLVPLHDTQIALMDDGDGVAERVARRLRAQGYTHVAVVAGGVPAWAAAGFGVFKGVHVPSKAFGELVEHERDTPAIDATELKAMVGRGEPVIILDGRSPEEYQRMTIPGAISCPNAELGLRIDALCPAADSTVVVNCAGRTRSIIGAQSLIELGLVERAVVGRVVALRNGTMGWRLAGFELDHGATRGYPDQLSSQQQAVARARARDMANREGMQRVGHGQLCDWLNEGDRTTYVFDVRSADEHAAGHPPHAVHAPGGQLVQGTDAWVVVRSARIVLFDHMALRAVITAHWLMRMGFEVYLLDPDGVRSTSATVAPKQASRLPLMRLDARRAAEVMAEGGVCVDLRASAAFENAHIRGAIWSIRPRLPQLSPDRKVLLVADDAGVAELAALDIEEQGVTVAGVLDASPEQWRVMGFEVTSGMVSPAQRIDYLFFVHDRHAGNMDAARAYLAWEAGLVAAMDKEERAAFRP